MCEEVARVVEMRPVEKAAPALSAAVGGRVSCVLGVDAVVLGDGGVSSGVVGRYVSAGDVSGGGDMELCGFDTVWSGVVSGGLCDLDSVSGGDIVVRVGDMSLSGGGDAVVLGVDGSVCGVNPVLADSILILCDIGTVVSSVDDPVCGDNSVVSSVDDPVCGDNSVVTAGEFDVCACGSLESDETGDVVSVDDVVACGDDPLLPDAVRVGGHLSVVGDTLVCDS